jgi:hypothetical protein
MEIKIKVGDKVRFSEIPEPYSYEITNGVVDEIDVDNNIVVVSLFEDGEFIDQTIFDLDGTRWDHSGTWKHDEIFVSLSDA